MSDADLLDPLHEDVDSPTPGLTHRYPDRVLMLITDQCSMYCRHCTRRRFAGQHDCASPKDRIEKAIEYIEKTPQVRDVLLSGGDALLVSDAKLEYIIKRLRAIKHVEVIRIGSRVPVVCPQRITPELVNMLKKYHPVWLNTHFNHPNEITEESTAACARLADAGIPLGNQSVLLRGVNDSVSTMKALVCGLVKIRVRPYYIYQCDLSMGLEHFRTPVSKGIEIIEGLRGHVSGFAVPTFVVDAPGGGGKIPVMPQYLISLGGGKAILRNFEGVITTYTEPTDYDNSASLAIDRKNLKTEGVSQLLSLPHQAISLEPMGLERYKKAEKWHSQKEEKPAKRGRKASAKAPEAEAAGTNPNKAGRPEALLEGQNAQPKRRGRKPKALLEAEMEAAGTKRRGRKAKKTDKEEANKKRNKVKVEAAAEPKRRGRKPSADKKKAVPSEPKRRGRKKKIIPPGILAALPHRKKKNTANPAIAPAALPEQDSKPAKSPETQESTTL